MRSHLWIVFALFTSALAHCQSASSQAIATASFLLNPDRPFVYLEFDHVGPGVRFTKTEPQTRIWLRLVNNCQVPVRVRTFGVPTGALPGEVGVMDEVKDNEPLLTISSDQEVAVPNPRKRKHKPSGYWGEVSSATTIVPGDAILFSIPADHLSDSWHIEIPLEFQTPKSTHLRDEMIGGEPLMRITYSEWDLPPKARKR